jgi:hypothetical protein
MVSFWSLLVLLRLIEHESLKISSVVRILRILARVGGPLDAGNVFVIAQEFEVSGDRDKRFGMPKLTCPKQPIALSPQVRSAPEVFSCF